MIRNRRKTKKDRRAVVLFAVLIVVSVLALAAYHYSDMTMAEYRSVDSYRRSIQAHAAANSGIHYAAAMLSDSNAFTNTLSSNPYDNSSTFQSQIVGTNDQARWQTRFSVIAPLSPDDTSSLSQPYHLGVTDEAGKINLNALLKIDSTGNKAHDLLMTLPNMTEDVADSIIDWLDPDDTPRTSGAENDYYQALSPPYSCKNGPLDSLEELLLVKGVTPQLLFGNDQNRNGIMDTDEDDGTGTVDPGWSAYLTVYSHELNVDSTGNARIYVNDSDLNTLSQNLTTALGADLANFIIAYRLYGPASSGTPAAAAGATGAGAAGAVTTRTTTAVPVTGAAGRGGSSSSGASLGTGRGVSGGGAAGGGVAGASGGSRVAVTGSASMATGSGAATATGAGANASGPLSGANRNAITNQLAKDRQGSGQKQLTNISSLYDLINASVSVPSGSSSTSSGGGATATSQTTINYPSPLKDQSQQESLLPLLLDKVTTSKSTDMPGRINVNTASQTVLGALKAIATTLSDNDIQNIIAQRPAPSSADWTDPVFQTPTWLVTRAKLNPTVVKSLEKYITTRTQVYRVQSVGYFDQDGPTARIEAVIDTNKGRPRILMWRDITELGKGYDVQNSNQ
jgi:type II secretory pathway component PulK